MLSLGALSDKICLKLTGAFTATVKRNLQSWQNVQHRKTPTPKIQIPKLSKFNRIWSKPTILETVIAESWLLETAYRQPGTKLTKKKQLQVFLFPFSGYKAKDKC